MPNHIQKAAQKPSECQNTQTNEQVLQEFNLKNGVTDEQRFEVLQLFQKSGHVALNRLLDQYLASMNQDRNLDWFAQKPPKPELACGPLPGTIHEAYDILGIGGMFAYLNVTYQAYKHGGRHCIISHPQDIFTFSGWTLHPEEDMDQRLIEMFQTKSLFINEAKRIMGISDAPQSLRFKSFRLDYRAMSNLAKKNTKEFLKNIKVALQYALLELTDSENRYARMNLTRNAATLAALEEMGCTGNDPGKHMINMCGRVVYEVSGESKVASKAELKKEFGMLGKHLSIEEIRAIYRADLKIFQDVNAGHIDAVQYPGGHFLLGYKDNALKLARENKVGVHENAVVTRIILDRQIGKFVVNIRTADNEEKTITANVLLTALGDYSEDVITVDGISTLFVITTDNADYRIHPTGMGEGGTIHIVPVWSVRSKSGGKTLYHHLGKATNGAIMGRDPACSKVLRADKSFLAHLEAHLKRIAPPASTFIWLAATECGRPVSAKQGYSVKPLKLPKNCGRSSGGILPLSFAATGGCGLGGNTAIVPEVQEALDRRSVEGRGDCTGEQQPENWSNLTG
ncbi:MAG: hypothetical protein WCA08_10240 [Desulfoferrobacter sp.]